MPVAVRVDVVNPFPSQLLRIQKKMSDWRPELKKGREMYQDHVEAVFATEGASSGHPWPALSMARQKTRGSQRMGWEAHPILHWDGDLIDVATMHKSSGSKVSGSYRTGKKELLMSISGDKVANQFGVPSRNLPAREFWPFSQIEVELFFKPFVDWANLQVSAGINP